MKKLTDGRWTPSDGNTSHDPLVGSGELKINTSVYNFNVCCQGEKRRHLVVQRHLYFERKRGDNSTTSCVLKIY